MTKTNRIYSKIFGYEEPVYFSDSELTFDFLNECELIVYSNEMKVHLIIEEGEVFSYEGDFLCFVADLELFGDFEEKNKCEMCMDTGKFKATIGFNLQESWIDCECDKHYKYV